MIQLPLRSKAASIAIAIAASALLVACDGSSGDKGSSDKGSSSKSASSGAKADGSTKEASAKPADVAADKMGTFTCKDVKDDACVGPTDKFSALVPVVHMTFRTKDLPKNGDVYTIQWIAEDVGKAAKPNTVIATLEKKVSDIPDFGMKSYFVNTELSKPTKGWPIGKYRVEVKLGDKLETTAKFAIE